MTQMVNGHGTRVLKQSPTPGEISLQDQRRMARYLKSFMTARQARAALSRFSRDTRGRSIEWIIAAAECEQDAPPRLQLDDDRLIALLVELAGTELLSDRELRWQIADNCGPRRLKRLHEYPSDVRGRRTHRSQVDAIAQRKWRPGRSWALHFVHVLGLPPIYAGWRAEQSLPDKLEVEPCLQLSPLRDFQDELRVQLVETLTGNSDGNRAILSLPTGAGKTRTTVEALLSWRVIADPERSKVLWIAQSDELCEQAVQSFREVWFDFGHRSAHPRGTLTIGRLWADRNADMTECDVIVASIQKLHAAARGEGRDLTLEDLSILGELTGAVVVDEAHRALAPTYGHVMEALGISFRRRRNATALVGLTATPRRTSRGETERLHRRFNNRILSTPALGADPLQTLRAQGILSTVKYETLDYEAKPIDLAATPTYADFYRTFEDIHINVLQKLGEEHRRNHRILQRILELDPRWPVLLFACSVQHAQAMASLLQHAGRSAACVLGSTRPTTRRALIERFRDGQLSVLCNYGVLTTGFDAPKVRCVVVARPTASSILYEQTVGRGMRGPEFGGTERCLVIDVDDNIRWRDKPVAVEYESLEVEMRHTS